MSGLVYLAGPITGATYNGCVDWRNDAIDELARSGIVGLSPMRGKDYLATEAKIADSYEQHALSSAKGIMARDRWDATRCDVLLANLSGADRVSIGTVMEIAWADAKRIPIVLVMWGENVHDHSMIREAAGFIVPTLEAALSITTALLRQPQTEQSDDTRTVE